MKVYAQKQNQPQRQSSSSVSQPRASVTSHSPRDLHANSDQAAIARFAHNFSRIPVTAGQDNEEPESIAAEDTSVTKFDAQAATPPRLTKEKVGLATKECGGPFQWGIKWKLDKKTTKGGLVVQKVEAKYDVTTCKGGPYTVPIAIFDPSWFPFWEAWEIKKNQQVTNQGQEDDLYSSPLGLTRSRGTFTITGDAQFYEGATLSNSPFKTVKTSVSKIAPMTKIDPKLPGGTGWLTHNLTATWDCCTKGQEETGPTLLKLE